MIVNNFQRGLVTNTEGISNPHETAQYVRNNRTNERGWLIPRKGLEQISDDSGFTKVFAYKSVVLAIRSSELVWARIGDQLAFQSFRPSITIIRRQGVPVSFHKIADTNDIFLLTGGPPIVISIPESPHIPSVNTAAVEKPTLSFEYTERGSRRREDGERDETSLSHVYLRAQAVARFGISRLSDPIQVEVIRRTDPESDQIFPETRANVTVDYERAFIETLEEVVLYSTELEKESGDPFYEIYRFSKDAILAGENTREFTFHGANEDYNPTLESREQPEEHHDVPNLFSVATNEFRSYGTVYGSNKVWLSSYDAATNERRYGVFSDEITLDLGGGTITGLKFIRDNLLIVYATNQIQVISTDPLAELHNVVDFINPQDDRGNPIGCVAPESVLDMGGIHWFLASNRVLYMYNGRSVRPMSKRVKVMFDTIALPVGEYGEAELSKSVAFAYDDDFYISISSMLEPDATEENNTTLLYDIEYGRWWQDSFGVQSLTKIYPDQPIGIIDGKIYKLYSGQDDAGMPIRRIWRNNPYAASDKERFESVHVYVQSPAQVDIKAITESETFETDIDVVNPESWDSMRAGCNLRGRLHSVEISTESDAVIDRIATNQKLRNR